MFVIERDGHMGFWWDGETPVYVEEEAGIFPSRSSCLEYLQKFHSKERAAEIIMLIKQGGTGKTYSF